MPVHKHHLAYLAGVVDGEGSLTLSQNGTGRWKRKHAAIVLTVYNSDSNLLNWIKSEFGGNVYFYKRAENPKWKPQGRWIVSAKSAALLIKKLLPYLIVKREQAIVMLAFYDTKITNSTPMKFGLPDKILKERERLAGRIRQLNRKGVWK